MSKFFELVDAAIALSIESRKRFGVGPFWDVANKLDFCTVKVSCGRGSGKTSYVVERARPWDVVIVLNEPMCRIYPRSVRAKVFTLSEVLDRDFQRGRTKLTPRNIYIDELGQMTQDDLAYIWWQFSADPDQTMIVLG